MRSGFRTDQRGSKVKCPIPPWHDWWAHPRTPTAFARSLSALDGLLRGRFEQQLLQFSDAVDRLSGFERGIPFDIQGYRA